MYGCAERCARNKELVRRYPFLLPRNKETDKVPDGYDFSYTELDDMPEGWRKAFGEQMCEEIADVLTEEGLLYDYRIVQIKEKWGSLRWYDSGATTAIYKIVSKYEKLSSKVCVRCGAPATRIITGWIMPVCDECALKIDQINNMKGEDSDDIS